MGESKLRVTEEAEKVLRHLFNGIISSIPALSCCFYIWAVGYYLPVLTRGFILIVLLSFLFGMFNSIFTTSEKERIEQLREQWIQQSGTDKHTKDILALMLSNMEEIREYYLISKRQATLAFGLSVAFCLAGIAGFVAVLLQFDSLNSEIISTGIVSSSFSELFAATALLIHRSTLKQLNIYYNSLHENERFLSIVNLANQLPEEKRTDTFITIISSLLDSISVGDNSNKHSDTQEDTQ